MPKNNPKISIITVSFNSVKTIEKTILSVLNQTFKDFEYIIIDGGSTDGTVDIIKKYNDKISYWVSEKDNGISDAFNKGIMASSGEIIGIINSDDWYEPNAIEEVINKYSPFKYDIYISKIRYWINNEKNLILTQNNSKKVLNSLYSPKLNHPSTFITRKAYNEIGLFNTKYKYAMDYDLILRLYKSGYNAHILDKIISNMKTGGVSCSSDKETYWEILKISNNKILGLVRYIFSIFKRYIKKIIKYKNA